MNLLTDFEAHKRDEDFGREDAKRHRETCSPAGSCYIPFVGNVRGEQHYCDIHRPVPAYATPGHGLNRFRCGGCGCKTGECMCRPCTVCGKTEPHRGPEECDRVLPTPAPALAIVAFRNRFSN